MSCSPWRYVFTEVRKSASPCTVTAGGTWLVRDADQNSLVSAFRPGNGGDLVFVGDVDVLRSTVEWSEMNDNILFARNLAQVVP